MSQVLIPKPNYNSQTLTSQPFKQIPSNYKTSAPKCIQPLLTTPPHKSAFKKYRQKKQSKTCNQHLLINSYLSSNQNEKNHIYKLKQIKRNDEETRSQFELLGCLQPAFGFYDPNSAPLYADQNDCKSSSLTNLRVMNLDYQKIAHQKYQQKIVQNILSEKIKQQQINLKQNRIQTKDDDCFLIIKNYRTKRQKYQRISKNVYVLTKSKYINKDKYLIKPKDKQIAKQQLKQDIYVEKNKLSFKNISNFQQKSSQGSRQIIDDKRSPTKTTENTRDVKVEQKNMGEKNIDILQQQGDYYFAFNPIC